MQEAPQKNLPNQNPKLVISVFVGQYPIQFLG